MWVFAQNEIADEQVVEAVQVTPDMFVVPAIIGAAVLFVILAVSLVLMKKRKPTPHHRTPTENPTIDIGQLPLVSELPQSPVLEVHGIAMRMAVLVVAPQGQLIQIPDAEQLRLVLDNAIPDLSEVIDLHKPIFRRWGAQLSPHGFNHSFFANMKLPGDKGRDTPWCAVSGRTPLPQGHLLVGFVFQALIENQLTVLEINNEGGWLDHIKVRRNV